MRLPIVAGNYLCAAGASTADAGPRSGPVDRTRVQLALPLPAGEIDLGILSEQCAGIHVVRYADADAVSLGTSDMGDDDRFAYRLGDRVYFSTASGGIGSAEIPCGARVMFDPPARAVTSTEHAKVRE